MRFSRRILSELATELCSICVSCSFYLHFTYYTTTKEYRILLLLAANKGRVLTYAQIYEQVWGDFTTGNENNTIGFHICNLREKLYRANPDAPFYIRSVREVGYSLEVIAE